MVSGKVLRAAGCSHCRVSVLRLFVTPSATPLIQAPQASSVLWRATSNTSAFARYHSSAKGQEDLGRSKAAPKSLEQIEKLEAASDAHVSSDHPPASTEGAVPWYLQVEPPRHVPVSEPPPLPEVPEGSPPIIPALLKYASEEMGLDDLSLLDLRELDPPPALGQNLFMLFGTARSERHLDVSAGRLVRWLRAKHRIIADADGLLGPNERKTKLRRKAKRARLLGTMGTDDADDGITTGWICVNLGTVNRSTIESAVVAEDGRIAGFGVPQTGSTIVVQVMTESRRAELGLETLWQRTLDRQSQKLPEQLNAGDADSPQNAATTLSSTPSRPVIRESHSGSPFSGQTRLFSTSHQTNSAETSGQLCAAEGAAELTPTSQFPELFASFTQQSPNLDHAEHDSLLEPISSSDMSALHEKLVNNGLAKTQMMELLRAHLTNLTPAEASESLQSASLKKIMGMVLQNFPLEQSWSLRLLVESRARQLGLKEHASLDSTRKLIHDMRTLAISASRQEILQLLGCIYASPASELHDQTDLAMGLLESVHTRGQSIVTNDIVVAIIEGLSWSGHPTAEVIQLQKRVEDLMVQAKLPYMGESLLLRLLSAYARSWRWDQFWETWRIPPRYAQPRSEAVYHHIYKLAAATNHPGVCAEAIHRCFQEMILEDPPIEPVGEIRDALLDCIRVADPKAEDHAAAIPPKAKGLARALVNREFVKLVREVKHLRPRGSLS